LFPGKDEDYWEVVFFFGQVAGAEVLQLALAAQQQGLATQQQVLVAVHFLGISGQFFCEPWLEAHPVNPMAAMPATARRVRSDFITWQR
jgi:hypothetical protein